MLSDRQTSSRVTGIVWHELPRCELDHARPSDVLESSHRRCPQRRRGRYARWGATDLVVEVAADGK